ncbi:SAM50 [Candida oxycetoniae]|uniref:SAM50 n=1 Tax=Candida oxycetoniae TaxID=497107 RepID=A0AAI9WZN5_9ASCO|nr:SAM50 [Candida oxycetoniae]KAI3406249.2 SAM50 [Candida oxycetoniae]
MSLPSRDEEFLESLNLASSGSTNESLATAAEKELAQLQIQKQEQMIRQNQQFLLQLFQDNASQPIKVHNVQITNGEQFRDSFIRAQFRPLLAGNIVSFESYLKTVDNIVKNFVKLGIVENILCNTHKVTAPISSGGFLFTRGFSSGRNGSAGAGAGAGAISVVPIFNTLPVKRFFAKTGTNIGNGEGDGYIQFQLRNIFGGGENLVFDAVTGTKTHSSYLVNYNQPLFNNCNYIWENQFSINSRKLDWIQSDVMSKTIVNKIYTQFHDTELNHEIVLENSLRTLSNYGSKSFEVMQQGGQSIKSSIGYNLIYDSRDNKHLPFSGKYFQWGVEYNGLFKFNKFPFLKTATQIQHSWGIPFLNSHILTSTRFGLLYPLTKKSSSSSFSSFSSVLDRFYIGGPNDVRSFSLNGLGPRDQNSFIGGDLFLNGGVSLITNVPRYKDSNFKFHNFLNCGRIVSLDRNSSFIDNFKELTHSYCLSYGFGILYNHPMARFELNFVLPLVANERDSIRKGIQYGIGVSFL